MKKYSFRSRMLLRAFHYILLNWILLFLFTVCKAKKAENDVVQEVIYSNSIRALSELREIENSYMEHLNNYVSFLQQKIKTLRMYDIYFNSSLKTRITL